MDEDQDERIDVTKLKYGLYLRRSTDDKERQQRSVDDQRTECQELAVKVGLNIVDEYEDHGSAKVPNNPKRGRFYDMLSDLRTGKIKRHYGMAP